MPPAATLLTALNITMGALYIASRWLTAAELLWNLHTYLPFSPTTSLLVNGYYGNSPNLFYDYKLKA